MNGSRAPAPWHLWTVGLAALFLHGWGAAFGFYALSTSEAWLPMDVVWVAALALTVLGALALLARSRGARVIFVLAFVVALAGPLCLFVQTEGPQIGVMIVGVNTVMLLLTTGLLSLYARAMIRRGVLD